MHLQLVTTLRSADIAAEARTRRIRWTWALPSAALAIALLDFLLVDSSLLLSDPDSIWHVATGRWIWIHRQLPHVDPFSHTFHGAPWIAKEWLSQLLLFAAHSVAGWWGVVVLAAASVCAAFVLLHEWLRRHLRPAVALLLTLAAIVLGNPHFLARPHVLVLPVIAAWMSAIAGAADRGRGPAPMAALLMMAWTNMHGSFPLGLGLAALLAVESVILAAPGSRWAAWRSWCPFLAVACLAALASPYGWHAIVVPLTVGKVEAIPFIAEWNRLSFDFYGVAALALLAATVLLVARDPKREALRAVAIGMLGCMMIRHVRFISLFGLVVPFLVARVLASRWGAGLQSPAPPRAALASVLVAPLAIAVGLLATMRPAPVAAVAPERAVAFVQAHHFDGPVYNSYDFGGFLIGKGIPTFVDGRTDQLFLGDFLPKLKAALDAPDNRDFAALLAGRHVTWALVKPHAHEAAKLASLPGWSRRYADETAAVYAESKAGAFNTP